MDNDERIEGIVRQAMDQWPAYDFTDDIQDHARIVAQLARNAALEEAALICEKFGGWQSKMNAIHIREAKGDNDVQKKSL